MQRLQRRDDLTIERRLCVEVEGIEAFENGEMREFRAHGYAALLSCGKLVGEQMIDELQGREVPVGGCA